MNTIDVLLKRWQELQPLPEAIGRELEQQFMLEFNYHSNRLEGNTLTYGQTRLALLFGETSGDAKLRDYIEMTAHNAGLELVKREADARDRPLSEGFVRDLNRIILVEDFYKTHVTAAGQGRYMVRVGVYKTRQNSVITETGMVFDYASPEETPALMGDLITWFNAEEQRGLLHPVVLATLLHYRYLRIHPFEDGNGRIARLLTNLVLRRHGYPMIIVPMENKGVYLHALHKCDVASGLTPSEGALADSDQVEALLEYIKERVQVALEKGIETAERRSGKA
jgi:Fic family protein